MALSWNEIKTRAIAFSAEWRTEERASESQSFLYKLGSEAKI